ncbi:MAG: TadE/TadG family type IV pilus assembly protein [Sphingobium sp.]
MTRKLSGRRQDRGLLVRLLHDARGNTMAIIAAAMIPLMGLIGGGIDMSRLYLTKTRLQQACDAGALAGRKAMASGSWTTTAGGTQDTALAMFDANFQQGDYGTSTRTRSYAESDGAVTGTASAVVPVTVMQVFGASASTVAVGCTAKLAIPNTDVMFVLDVTGSMNCVAGDSDCSNNGNVPATGAKITGLKSAVKCFYEALMKVNTAEVCGGDPTATTYNGSAQIRIGFVPYSVNVNVGKLLPSGWFADSWTYQSRQANTTQVWTWTAGTESAKSWNNWSAVPSNLSNASSYSDWATVASSTVTINGTSYPQYRSALTSAQCTSPNTNGGAVGYTDSGSLGAETVQSTTNDPPTYPAASQTVTHGQSDAHTATAYKYTYNLLWLLNICRLQSATRDYTLTRTGTSTRPINWTQITRFDSWTYKPRALDISGLKNGTGWNGSVSVPALTTTSLGSFKPSGSSSSVNYLTTAPVTATWDGCIEERQTVRNTDGTPGDEWGTIPAAAYDMNIDLVPSASTAGSQWGPMLEDAVWARYDGTVSCGKYTCPNNTTSNVTTSSDLSRNHDYYCTTEAKKLQSWTTPAPFESYVNSLTAIGNTYHDIGMIWGARFISPTGIFATQNANLSRIERHIIFMTDGDTMTAPSNYSAYGVHWWDRRQTSYAPDSDNLNAIVNARLTALCTAIKNKNITLWVIGYGGASGINSATTARLQACATSGKYFAADNTAALTSRFKQIASDISELRLTN